MKCITGLQGAAIMSSKLSKCEGGTRTQIGWCLYATGNQQVATCATLVDFSKLQSITSLDVQDLPHRRWCMLAVC